jgi:hypothetical protein
MLKSPSLGPGFFSNLLEACTRRMLSLIRVIPRALTGHVNLSGKLPNRAGWSLRVEVREQRAQVRRSELIARSRDL